MKFKESLTGKFKLYQNLSVFILITFFVFSYQLYGQDSDGDGIIDALDAQPDIASAIVLNINESNDLNANGDALKKEGNYQDTFPNLVLPYTKKETTADYSSGNQSLYGNLELFNDGKLVPAGMRITAGSSS